MRFRKIAKRLLWAVVIVFLLMNAMAFFHAYKFTHFTAGAAKKQDAARMGWAAKLHALFLGIDLPRPENTSLPAVPYERVRLKSNKWIEGWWMPVTQAKGAVVICHGYGGEKSSMLDKAYVFQKLGYSTFLVDFMGAGGSEGKQTTIGFFEGEEVASCVQWLLDKGERNIVLFGTSMGAAAIMKAMHDHPLPVQSVILECPFGTLLQTVKNRFAMVGAPSFPMAHLLLFWGGVQNGFNTFSHNPTAYAEKIKCPVLLLYGAQDIKVTLQETQSIYRNLAGPKKLVIYPGAGHENYLRKYRQEWTEEVSRFLSASLR